MIVDRATTLDLDLRMSASRTSDTYLNSYGGWDALGIPVIGVSNWKRGGSILVVNIIGAIDPIFKNDRIVYATTWLTRNGTKRLRVIGNISSGSKYLRAEYFLGVGTEATVTLAFEPIA